MDKVERIKELTRILNRYRDSYYNDSIPMISDYEYDELFDELVRLENQTGIILSNSPAHTVGYEVKSKLSKVKHSHKMLSLDKTKSVDDLMRFIDGRESLLMCKMDGLTISLTYDNGELVRAETRGNGEEGEDITHNAKVFVNIPLQIEFNGRLEVDGEAIITYQDFERINNTLSDNDKYKNPRNLVSGSVRQLDSKIAASRNIRFIAWKISCGMEDDSMFHRLNNAQNIGFDIVPALRVSYCGTPIEENINELKEYAELLGYPIDGLVCCYDNIPYGESLGMTGHHPKHSVAFKFYDEEALTILRDIEWSMGKTGDLTPVAIFDEVELDGTSVSRASLHNISICKLLQLGIGDEITVYKANQIIPQIRDNLTRSNSIEYPDKCPICGGSAKIIKDNDTEVLKCTNNECKGKLLGRLSHAASKNALNIDGLSDATLEKLINNGWISSIKDIYHLYNYAEEMMKMDGFGEKSTSKLLQSIEESRRQVIDKFIYALSIPLIGRTASKTICKYFSYSYSEFIDAWSCGFGFDWTQLNDFGSSMHTSMAKYFLSYSYEIAELANEFIFDIVDTITIGNENDLTGKVFVITGSLSEFKNRDEAKEKIESQNGKVNGSVSSKTSYLVNNDVNSITGKNKKAKELGIPIITETELMKILG